MYQIQIQIPKLPRMKGISFMSSIKGTAAYWKTFLSEVLAIVKQLGLPTFFMTKE